MEDDGQAMPPAALRDLVTDFLRRLEGHGEGDIVDAIVFINAFVIHALWDLKDYAYVQGLGELIRLTAYEVDRQATLKEKMETDDPDTIGDTKGEA